MIAPYRKKLRIVVTAGPTREFFDSVRFISNASTGKMGYAIASAAARAGHAVTLVSGPVSIAPPSGVRTIRVTTAAEMSAATKRSFARADAAVFTAAVGDYRPARRSARKLPKKRGNWSIRLESTEDIAASIGRIKGRRMTIAFAMEDHDGRRKAERKLRRKNCDAIVLNGPENVGSDRAAVEFLQKGDRWERWPAGTKRAIAMRIIRAVERLTAQSTRRAR